MGVLSLCDLLKFWNISEHRKCHYKKHFSKFIFYTLSGKVKSCMRCAVCGKEVEEGTICAKCYLERNEVIWVDDIIRLTRCPRCGFFKLAGKWREVSYDDALMDAIYSSLRVHPDLEVDDVKISGNEGRYLLRISGELWGEEVDVERYIEVRIQSEVCLRCSREAGGYYESIVQVRAEGRDIEEDEFKVVRAIVEEVLHKERENMKAFVSKIVERKEGIDYYIGDRNIGRKISRRIADELGGKITESKKLTGRSDGRDLFRFTYSVRLPVYREGDVVEEGGEIAVVTNQRLGKGVAIESGETINLQNPRIIARKSEIRKSVVLNMDEFAVEVLHPSTHEVVSVKKPKIALKPGDEVFVAEHDGKIYVIPKELMV